MTMILRLAFLLMFSGSIQFISPGTNSSALPQLLNLTKDIPTPPSQLPPWSWHILILDEIEEFVDTEDHYDDYTYEEDYDEAKVSKRDNSKVVVPGLRPAPRCVRKKRKSVVKASPPSFRVPRVEMQQLAAGHLGHRVELFCPHRKGCPRATIMWTKDGKVLKKRGRMSGLSTIRLRQNGVLIIEDNKKADDGNYTCIISNKFGTISHSIMVQSVPRVVAMEPKIHQHQPGNHTVVVGTNLTLQCQLTVEDESSPHYVGWYKHYQVNGTWMDEEGTPYAFHLQDSHSSPPPEDDEELVLSSLKLNDTGWYSCRVKNQYGNLVKSGYVQVVEFIDEQQAVVSTPSPTYTYVSIGLGGGIGLCLTSVLVMVFVKYRKEREEKAMAIKTAQCVARWTKKIIIEKNLREDDDELLSPVVRMEKVMVKGDLSAEDLDKLVELYEFQLDIDWEFPRELILLGEELGQGAFGRVLRGAAYKCVVQPSLGSQGDSGCPLKIDPTALDPVLVAVKMLKEEHSEEEVVNLVKEIEMMKAVGGHVNIVNLLGACTQPSGQPLLAILEFAEFGNLRDHLRWRRYGGHRDGEDGGALPLPISFREMLSFAWQVARGMQFLSDRKCVHRDLAARNVLVAKGGVAKIADFGLARDTQDSDYYRKRGEGKLPVLWMSPESLFAGVSTTRSDIWSFGVLLWEIVTWGERPYTGVNTEAVLDLIKDGYRMSCPHHCPLQLYALMNDCWQFEPSKRPSWSLLVDALLTVHDQTLPDVYLDHALPVIPTPPSSPESRGSIFSSTTTTPIKNPQACNPGYMPGISPLYPSLPPSAPPYSLVTVSRRMSEESGYSSNTGGGGGTRRYYNV